MNDPPNAAPGAAGTPVPNPAQVERWLLCDLMTEVGPGAPTQCVGWSAADLAAHLVVRERRPDAAAGIALRPLAGYTEFVRRRTKETVPFPQLVELVRQGPPKYSPYRLPGADKWGNTVEFFVHHEDIRRSRPDWRPRRLPPDVEELLWRRLKMARLVLRKVPAQVTVVRPDGRTQRLSKRGRSVRVHGPASELVLWALGRTGVAQVRFTGDADAVKALSEHAWRL